MKIWKLLAFGVAITAIFCLIDLALLHYINQHLVNIGAMATVYSWETIAYASVAIAVISPTPAKSDDAEDLADAVLSAITSRLVIAATLVIFGIIW